jgi:hypothetical protein
MLVNLPIEAVYVERWPSLSKCGKSYQAVGFEAMLIRARDIERRIKALPCHSQKNAKKNMRRGGRVAEGARLERV